MKTRLLIIVGIILPLVGPTGISLAEESSTLCDAGPSPGDDFVFFDCSWVEVPSHWKYEDGLWQEDPSIMKLDYPSMPICPGMNVCTCSGKFFYYNSTDKQCYKSPYIPISNQNACKEYADLDFAGWRFNEHSCDWISLSDPYRDDESLRLASGKIDVGGLGINPVFDKIVIITGILIGSGLLVGLLAYWRRRK
ncbi:MAG: hypothetical protein OEL81_01545 [Nitrosopumilus sp.]|nr:hypothetical protein [Nitrosopumilus sp.]